LKSSCSSNCIGNSVTDDLTVPSSVQPLKVSSPTPTTDLPNIGRFIGWELRQYPGGISTSATTLHYLKYYYPRHLDDNSTWWRVYSRIRRALESRERKGELESRKANNIRFYQTVDLTSGVAAVIKNNSNRPSKRNRAAYLPSDLYRMVIKQFPIGNDTKEYLTEEFTDWLEGKKEQAILLKDSQDNWMLKPYRTRYSKDYVRDVKKRILGLDVSEGVLLTLTTDPAKFLNIWEATASCWQSWNRLHASITKELGHVEYVAVLEFTKSLLPHLHIIFIGRKWIMKKQKLSDLWDKTQAKIVDIQRIGTLSKNSGRNMDIKSYLLKYLNKVWEKRKAHPVLAAYWVTGRRFYNSSRGLFEKLPYIITDWVFFSPMDRHTALQELQGGVIVHHDLQHWFTGKDPPG